MGQADPTEATEALINRLDVLELLCESPAQIRDLVEGTEHSRRTITRAITELEEIGLVERGGEGVVATPAGQLSRQRLRGFLEDYRDILATREVLEPLPSSITVDPAFVARSESVQASGPAPYQPLERVQGLLENATAVRAVLPALDDPRLVRLLYELVVTDGGTVELVVTPAVFETLESEFPRRMAAMMETDRFTVAVGSVPPVALGLVEREVSGSGSSEFDPVTAYLLVFNREGGVHGAILNDADAAVEWAEGQFDAARERSTDRTAALRTDGSGATSAVPMAAPRERSIPIALERQGFVALNRAFFREEPVAAPATAWRAGLTLPEVHTGYAISRYPSHSEGSPAAPSAIPSDRSAQDSGTDRADRRRLESGSDLTTTLLESLRSGSTCALLGPPGAGKSTVCKQVACRWYDADLGPVLYRRSDLGRRFAAIDELVDAVEASDGHALIVLEDAVRPGAAAIFDGLDRLTDHESVSVLLDARESEWGLFTSEREEVPPIALHHVPALRRTDCERLVDHFERTSGRDVEVSTEALWSAIRRETAEDGSSSHAMLRLIHRLSTLADPLSDGPTALEEDVRLVHDAVVVDELSRRIALLVNALNAAGLAVDRHLCYLAVSPGDESAVDRVLETLEGRILFGTEENRFETVHEEWSVAFLEHALALDPTESRRVFGTGISTMLEAVTDPARWTAIADHLGTDEGLEAVEADTEGYVGEILEALYDLVFRRATLVELFADGAEHAIAWPESCRPSLRETLHRQLVEALITASRYDEAETAWEEGPWPPGDPSPERLHQRAWLSHRRGDYEGAIDRYESALELAEDCGDRRAVHGILRGLGLALWRSGRLDEAETRLERSRSLALEVSDDAESVKVGVNLGAIAVSRGNYERAIELNEENRQLAMATGDRYREALCLNNLGYLAMRTGAYDRARGHLEESLGLRRDLGYRSGEAGTLNNLGLVALRTGDVSTARRYFETGLEIAEEVDSHLRRAESHRGLGLVARAEGDLDGATGHLERARDTFEDMDAPSLRAAVAVDLGWVALEREDHRRAARLAERASALGAEVEAHHVLNRAHHLQGAVASARDESTAAIEHWETAVQGFAESGAVDRALEVLEALLNDGELDLAAAERWSDRARDLLADAPAAVHERHGDWVERR